MYSEEHRLEKQREAQRKYRERHAKRLKAEQTRIRASGEMRPIWREKTARWRNENKEKHKSLEARWYHNAKDKAFEILGNKCAVCGFEDRRALQIDHIVAIGDAERRKQNHRGKKLYRAVMKNPDNFQLLCANHNWIKRTEQNELKKRSD